MTTNIIEMRGITKRFGAVLANKNIKLAIPANTIHAIVGENGAGKSTIMKILYGFYTADEGEIVLDGQPRAIRTPHDAIALGVGMVHQHFMLVPPMTVLENIVLGAEPGNAMRIDFKKAEAEISQLARDFGFNLDLHAKVEDLSVGQQQRIEVLKALYRGARILILDEPTAVLTPPEVEEFFKILRSMREQGKTIIIITHKLNEVLALSDNVTVMRDGQVVGGRKTSETDAAELARLMVGRDVLLRVEKEPAQPKAVVLSVKHLKLGSALNDISFDVRAGEIVGIAGVEGNGQTELIEVLSGLQHAANGSLTLGGQELNRLSARAIKELGIAHIPEDRHARGLLLEFDLADNTILGTHYRAPAANAFGLLDDDAIVAKAERLIRDFDVRPPNAALPARALSGGNQQKLIIGREFDLQPKLLLVSQPTRGVDIGAIEFIHRKLIGLRDAGAAILLVSAELEEVLSLSDRVLVMYQGRIVGEVDPQTAAQEEIGLLMTGGKRK
ncbi:MAG: ABC transporter ATP-binding protein [Acidobacteria bacterium]|nr:ABC transporter ATP-binding protein [Acidobacteriota bacterium]MBI3423433.1 ABC transporter ATP-binding protein [Acidobacteriota bacterium]